MILHLSLLFINIFGGFREYEACSKIPETFNKAVRAITQKYPSTIRKVLTRELISLTLVKKLMYLEKRNNFKEHVFRFVK